MSALARPEVTVSEIAGVSFGFYNDDEIRKLSVKRVTSPLVFDNLKNVVPNGLYDSGMGPMDTHETCSTCGLRYQHCPGHSGHIELAVPVFNPLVFTMMFKLLRCTCLHCFSLKMDAEALSRYCCRLSLLLSDRLVDAAGSAPNVSRAARTTTAKMEEKSAEADTFMGDDDMEEDGKAGEWGTWDGSAKAAGQPAGKGGTRRGGTAPAATTKLTASTLEAIRNCISEFMHQMPLRECANCKASNPSIRREGSSKVFQMPLTPAQFAKNATQGTSIRPVVIMSQESARSSEATRLQAELAAGIAASHHAGGGKSGTDIEAAAGAQPAASSKTAALNSVRPRFMTPAEVREVLRRMWLRHGELLSLMFAVNAHGAGLSGAAAAGSAAYHMFFLQTVAVPPNKFRPVSKMGEGMFEHPQNVVLGEVIKTNLELEALASEPPEAAGVSAAEAATARMARSLSLWLDLQSSVNGFIDSTASDKGTVGIRQQLEKKEGLFRKNMMGKRVNFACRSVISPDPYIATGEIGVPPYFAKRLSYPEHVTQYNAAALAAAVRAGPDTLPGAVAVEDEQGRVLSLATLPAEKRDAVAKQLLARAAAGKAGRGKIVYRTLRDGDLMLTNRQPTLHKPGMMAHRARVLKGERTIRMHYANCATFNADFDGDEINLHLPQDAMGRAEGYGLVHADEQYIVPTDGKPIRGLIQDHVVAGVLMTKRDTFMPREQFMQLLYAACCSSRPGADGDGTGPAAKLDLPPPAVIVPRVLFTGKQLLSAVVRHFTRGMAPVTMGAKTKTPAEAWGSTSGEAMLQFRGGDLVTGTFDKAQFGSYGLVHSVQELYGNVAAGQLLSGFSRLFTTYLQMHGFTCGIDDVLLSPAAEAKRAATLLGAEAAALSASATAVGLADLQGGDANVAEAAAAEVQAALEGKYHANANMGALHDMATTSALNPFASDVVKWRDLVLLRQACIPGGEAKPFRRNCMTLMTTTGAKGSQVNASQISCLLGQQALEGRRVPRMSSGKTLPCFAAFDGGARSGGFVGDRFLTGLRPQEYYFHCMAGREGLVDTTVKTSRSGYLQRCLVKNLEALHVHYDSTVRDDTDGSVVQFNYGEDGTDVLQTGFLTRFGFQAENADRFAQQLRLEEAAAASHVLGISDAEANVARANEKRQKLRAKARKGAAKAEAALRDAPAPLMSSATAGLLGVVSEAFADALADYVEGNPDGLLKDKGRKRKKGGPKDDAALDTKGSEEVDPRSGRGFQRLMELKYARAAAAAGEAVGVLAAQSVGEPSTQMTLNTFHMAGRGEANVTLGIPRLRELLMTAAMSIKTPVMTLALRAPLPDPARRSPVDGLSRADKAAALTGRLRRLSFAEILRGLTVRERITKKGPGLPVGQRVYSVEAALHPMASYPREAGLSFPDISAVFTNTFVPRLQAAVRAATKKAEAAAEVEAVETRRMGGEEGGAAGPAAAQDEGAVATARKSEKRRRQTWSKTSTSDKTQVAESEDENAEEEEDENAEADADMEEGKLAWAGGRHEAATYDAGEAEDVALQKAAAEAAAKEEEAEGSDEEPEPPGDSTMSGDEGEGVMDGTPQKGKRRGKGKKADSQALPSDVAVDEEAGSLTVVVRSPLRAPKLLMLELVERVAAAVLVRATHGILKANAVDPAKGEGPVVEAQGINFHGVWQHQDLIDVDAILTNDVGAVLKTLGVEAARSALLAEISRVFGVYGIGVDQRHLSLIADFMTHQGGYRACSRLGIDSNASPFLKISFETATAFLTEATMRGTQDDLSSPAARLVLGRVVESGTGALHLIQDLPPAQPIVQELA